MENSCRICLRITEKLLPLFKNQELIHKIKVISSVKLFPKDELPSNICCECTDNVNTFYNFRKVIINNDADLRERLHILKKVKTETAYENEKSDFDDYDEIPNGEEVCHETTSNDSATSELKKEVRVRLMKICSYDKSSNLYQCDKCEFVTTDARECVSHKKRHVDNGVCNVCGKVIRVDNLKKHIQSHTDPPVNCDVCGKMFKNSQSIRNHLLRHGEEKYSCKICGKRYSHKADYNRHIKENHDPNNIRIVTCVICGKVSNPRLIAKHLRSHTGERPYQCEFCKKGFSSSYARKIHRRQHTNEKPFSCEPCGVAFHQRVSLRTHMKSKHNKII